MKTKASTNQIYMSGWARKILRLFITWGKIHRQDMEAKSFHIFKFFAKVTTDIHKAI